MLLGSVTSELKFSAGINSSNFEIEKGPLKKFIHGIIEKEAEFVKASNVELTFKKELEISTPSRIQTSTGSILVMKIGPFDEKSCREIGDFVDSKFRERFEQENQNTVLVLGTISKASK